MDNIVEFRTARPRSRRPKAVVAEGSNILFFTGVRYVRPVSEAERRALCGTLLGEAQISDLPRLMTQEESEIALDLAAY